MAEGRDAGSGQQRQRFFRRRRQRHGKRLGRAGEAQQRLDRELGIELGRGADDEDRRVVAVVGQQALDGAGHDLGLGAGQRQIDQLALAGGDAERLQPVDQHLRRIGDVEPSHRHAIDHHGGTTARRRRHGNTLAPPLRLRRGRAIDQQRRHVDQRFEHRDAGDAVAAAEGVEGGVGAGDGAGMRLGQLLADIGAAKLVDDHRLAGGMGAPRRLRQTIGVAQGLHEQQDGIGLRIVDQHVGDLAHREVDLVADRDQAREADATRIGTRQQRADQAAALADQRPPTLAQLIDGEGRIGRQRHRRIGADGADAVGADQAQTAFGHDAFEVVLQRGAGLTRIGEAAGQDRRHPDAALGAGGECIDGVLAVEQNIGVIDLARDGVEVLVGLDRENLGAGGIDRQDFAREAVFGEEALRPRRRLSLVGRGADQGDAFGFEQGAEEAVGNGHGPSILRA